MKEQRHFDGNKHTKNVQVRRREEINKTIYLIRPFVNLSRHLDTVIIWAFVPFVEFFSARRSESPRGINQCIIIQGTTAIKGCTAP